MKRTFVAKAAATFLGLGYLPFAPGTAASLAALAIFAPLRTSPMILLPLLGILGALAVWSCGKYALITGRPDPKQAVLDEVFGMGSILAALPCAGWREMLAAFALFRAFDVVKPFPIGRLETLPGGWGILADDAGAAVYTILALKALDILF